MRNASRSRSWFGCSGRPPSWDRAALGEQAEANGPEQTERGGLRGPSERDQADHPALLVLGLEATEPGCHWLFDRWQDLKAVVDETLGWNAVERFKAIRLLGLDERDPMDAGAIMLILHACQVLDPDAGNLVECYWNELMAANPGWPVDQLRAWVPEMKRPEDKATAAQELAEIIKVGTDRLEFKLKEFEERHELEAKYWAHESAFDLSPDGERIRRYETKCQRDVYQYFRELDGRKAKRNSRRYLPAYEALQSREFRRTECSSHSPEAASQTELVKSMVRLARERAKAADRPVASGRAEQQASSLQNEPNEELLADSFQNAIASEVTLEKRVATVSQTASELRNEPNQAGFGRWVLGKETTNLEGGSRRARRARRARERAKQGN